MACTGRAGCRTGGRRSFDESASARHHTPVVCKYRRGRRRHGLPPNHEHVPPNRRRRTGPPARPSPALRAPAFQATTSHRLRTGAPLQPIADCDRVPSRRSRSHHGQATGQIRRAPIGSFKYPSGGGLTGAGESGIALRGGWLRRPGRRVQSVWAVIKGP